MEDGGEALALRLRDVRARIASAAHAAGRDPKTVALIAVSKTHGRAAVEAAIAAGQTVFGENRAQEAAAKFADAGASGRREQLHLIGPLQTNKAETAVRLADAIETLDRPKLADAIARAAEKAGRVPGLFVQVNTGREPQKAGVLPEQAGHLIEAWQRRFGAALQGLMVIPPVTGDPRPHFEMLAALARRHGLPALSMGMSGDFEAAIAAGATHVRIGTAIFGSRPVPPV